MQFARRPVHDQPAIPGALPAVREHGRSQRKGLQAAIAKPHQHRTDPHGNPSQAKDSGEVNRANVEGAPARAIAPGRLKDRDQHTPLRGIENAQGSCARTHSHKLLHLFRGDGQNAVVRTDMRESAR